MTIVSAPWRQWITVLVSVVAFIAAASILADDFMRLTWRDIAAAVMRTPPQALLIAVAMLPVGLAAVSSYDALAMAAIGRRASWRQTFPTSILAFALGYAGATGLAAAAAVRYRAYRGLGLNAAQTALVSGIAALTGLTGGLVLLGFGAANGAMPPEGTLHLPPRIIVAAAIAGPAVLLLYILTPKITLKAFAFPDRRVRLYQIAASTLDWTASAMLLYVLLPASVRGPYLTFLPVFGLAGLLGAGSGSPGGLGPFDAVLLAALGPTVGFAETTGALLLYRAIYPGVALVGSMVTLTLQAALARRRRPRKDSKFIP